MRRRAMSKVFVYFNLHKKMWSVKDLATGRVSFHSEGGFYLKDATFRVSQAGRARVLRQKRKNVHAGVVGELYYPSEMEAWEANRLVSYNPYRGPDFVEMESGKSIFESPLVLMGDRRVWAKK
jgi:hypothetical protein